MTVSENLNNSSSVNHILLDKNTSKDIPFSVIAVAACSILFFVMGRFYFADLFGIKRFLEIILFLLISTYTVTIFLAGKIRLNFNPLIILTSLLWVNSIVISMDYLRAADLSLTVVALIVISFVPMRSFYLGIKLVIGIATIFSVLAIIEWFILLAFPQLSSYAQLLQSENGLLVNFHPLMLLGLVTGEEYTLLGFQITRLKSFASEPSLLGIFFIIPASFSFILNEKFWSKCGLIIILFCLISLSGSVFLSLAFSIIYFILSRFVRQKILFFFLPIALLAVFLVVIITQGVESFLNINSTLVGYGDFLDKASSFNTRSEGIIIAFESLRSSPFGRAEALDLPAPLFFSAIIKGGYLGLLLLLIFYFKLSSVVHSYTL